MVRNKDVYTSVGLTVDGKKKVLGLWVQNTEGATFWLAIVTELRQRRRPRVRVHRRDSLPPRRACLRSSPYLPPTRARASPPRRRRCRGPPRAVPCEPGASARPSSS